MAFPVRITVTGRSLDIYRPSDDRTADSTHLSVAVADDILWVADSNRLECADMVTGHVRRAVTLTDVSYTVPVQLGGGRLLIERTERGEHATLLTVTPAGRCLG